MRYLITRSNHNFLRNAYKHINTTFRVTKGLMIEKSLRRQGKTVFMSKARKKKERHPDIKNKKKNLRYSTTVI